MPAIVVETRARTLIENDHDLTQPDPGEIAKADAYRVRFPAARHRNTAIGFTYNCHGLTFASRRTQIWKSEEVQKILAEDGYVRVADARNVLPGDIIIYQNNNGEIDHSGIVVANDPQNIVPAPLVLSKWGSAHEVVHVFNYCPYPLHAFLYYRVVT